MTQAILITGSEGRIGKILQNGLSGHYDIACLDRLDIQRKGYFKADISNYAELQTSFALANHSFGSINAMIHLAADLRVDAPWESVLQNNIIGTRNVYACAEQYSIKKVVFASSNHATGAYEGTPPTLHLQNNAIHIKTTDEVRPDSDYGTSKVFGEAVARQYLELYGIKSICLRIGSVLYPDDPRTGDEKQARFMKTWLSHRDLVHLVDCSLKTDKDFGIYYGVSDNAGRFWGIYNALMEIGYRPQDNASLLK